MHRIHLKWSSSDSEDKSSKDEPVWTSETLLAHMFSNIKLSMEIIDSERYFVELWDLWDEIKAVAITNRENSDGLAEKTIKGLFFWD